jgi:hypothetical protein
MRKKETKKEDYLGGRFAFLSLSLYLSQLHLLLFGRQESRKGEQL